ncbi:MAG: TonB-dependent receptor [Bacteroidaceae bacterium]|nr:TonB-dependent receptor [Bacteroidaceae bacterium]
MKRFFIFTLTLLCCIFVSAQSKYQINGTVIEKETNEAVLSATVQLLALPDSTFKSGTTTNAQGGFVFNNINKGKYTIKISYIGCHTKYINLDLTNKNEKKVDIGYITLLTNAIMLKEAQVTAHASKVSVSGDSLVYNAAAYRTPEGSVLEDLVKQLPGAKVDSEGNITINGKSVSKILVDGKEYFLNDKSVAMKNIPTEMIDKIKSYDRKSDLARVTGIDDGEEETVLDLTVKKGMNNGWFGNVNLGAGTKSRYSERLFVQRFNDNTQLSIIGGANNVNDMGFGGGGGRGWGHGGNGLRTSKEIGSNIATLGKNIEVGGSVHYRYNGSDTESRSSSESFNNNWDKFKEISSKSLSSNSTLNTQFRIEWKPDTTINIIFRPNLSYSRNRGYGNSNTETYNEDPNNITDNVLDYNNDIVNQMEMARINNMEETPNTILDNLMDIVTSVKDTRQQSYSTSTNFNGEIQANKRLNNNGRNITLRVNGGFSESKSKQLSAEYGYQHNNEISGKTINNRYYNTPGNNHNIAAQLTYSEPIAKRTYLQFSYRFQYSYSKNDRKAFVYDSQAYQDLNNALNAYRYDIPAILRFMDEANYMMRDTLRLSQFSEYRNYNQTIGLSFRKITDNINLSIGIDALPQRSTLNYEYLGKEYPEVTRKVFDFAPRVNFRYSFDKQTQLNIRYNARTSQPSMTNLLDLEDDTELYNVSLGNPSLKPSLTHSANIFFNTYDVEHQRGIFTYTNFNTTHNSISNKIVYGNGQTITQPVNINGNWNMGGGIGFNTGLGKNKAFTLGINTGVNFSNNVGLFSNSTTDDLEKIQNKKEYMDMLEVTKTVTKDWRLTEGIDFAYRTDAISISLTGSLTYRNSKNNINSNSKENTYDFAYGTEFQWTMPWGTQLATDIGMNSRRGYARKEDNTNELIWNAQVSHSFLRGKALTLSLAVNDILGQQSNISRMISATMRSDTRYNSIYQYAMLRATYRFSIFGGKNSMGTNNERQGWGMGFGGGRPPMGGGRF